MKNVKMLPVPCFDFDNKFEAAQPQNINQLAFSHDTAVYNAAGIANVTDCATARANALFSGCAALFAKLASNRRARYLKPSGKPNKRV